MWLLLLQARVDLVTNRADVTLIPALVVSRPRVSFLNARGAPPPLALAQRFRAALGPQALPSLVSAVCQPINTDGACPTLIPMLFAVRVALVFLAFPLLTIAASSARVQPPPDLDALARRVRDVIRTEYAEPVRFNYVEEGSDVEVSMLGKVSVGPVQRFEVRQEPPGEAWRRLVAVDGKPLDAGELARLDAEHRKQLERVRSETPRQRAARLKKEADELRERDEVLDDAERVFAFSFVGREQIDGQPVIVVNLMPRPNARVTTSDGQRMKQFAGRMWISDGDYHIARVRLHAVDSVSVGWGVVARVEPGSGFDFARKKFAGTWVASELTIEGSGHTLLFRRFQIKTVTTYSGHRPYSATVNEVIP